MYTTVGGNPLPYQHADRVPLRPFESDFDTHTPRYAQTVLLCRQGVRTLPGAFEKIQNLVMERLIEDLEGDRNFTLANTPACIDAREDVVTNDVLWGCGHIPLWVTKTQMNSAMSTLQYLFQECESIFTGDTVFTSGWCSVTSMEPEGNKSQVCMMKDSYVRPVEGGVVHSIFALSETDIARRLLSDHNTTNPLHMRGSSFNVWPRQEDQARYSYYLATPARTFRAAYLRSHLSSGRTYLL